jgi:hypothetical protein
MRQDYDSNFVEQLGQVSKRQAETPAPVGNTDDPTFDIRRKQANLCEAVMIRVVELEEEAKLLTETAKKLRAAVMANT